MSATLPGSGRTPLASNSNPKNFMFVFLISHFPMLKTSPCCRATFIRLCRCSSCSASVLPNIPTSSSMLIVPGHFSRIRSILSWKTSRLRFRPHGSLLKQNRPKGLLNVVKRLYSSSSCTDQYPCLASSLENKPAPVSLWVISSNVGVG